MFILGMVEVFTLKLKAEKYSENKKGVFAYVLDFQKYFDKVQRGKLWKVLKTFFFYD